MKPIFVLLLALVGCSKIVGNAHLNFSADRVLVKLGPPDCENVFFSDDEASKGIARRQPICMKMKEKTVVRELEWKRVRWTTFAYFILVNGVWSCINSVQYPDSVIF